MNTAVLIGAGAAVFFGMRYLQRRDWVKPEEAKSMVSQGARLVDVRSEAEFAANHLPGAVNIPLPSLGGRLGEIGKKDSDVVVYCLSGARSSAAKRLLGQSGFAKVHNLGSMNRWAA